jgi:hypothetical protein
MAAFPLRDLAVWRAETMGASPSPIVASNTHTLHGFEDENGPRGTLREGRLQRNRLARPQAGASATPGYRLWLRCFLLLWCFLCFFS